MALRLFNSLHRRVEAFTPLFPEAESIGFYCCGPTVYDFGHIGNFRTFVFADLLRRYFEFRGFRVNHVMNITDDGQSAIITMTAENRLVDFRRVRELRYTDEEQKNLYPLDKGLEFVNSIQEKEVYWGNAKMTAPINDNGGGAYEPTGYE
jgi:cysteinyl-tRNA synthetase